MLGSGSGWSRTHYFADTRANVLCPVPLDLAIGHPTGAPKTLHAQGGPGGLDGAVVDPEGRTWCTIWGGACLHVYSSEGELLRRVAVPARQPSCLVFVGADFRRALVTRPEPRVRLGAD